MGGAERGIGRKSRGYVEGRKRKRGNFKKKKKGLLARQKSMGHLYTLH